MCMVHSKATNQKKYKMQKLRHTKLCFQFHLIYEMYYTIANCTLLTKWCKISDTVKSSQIKFMNKNGENKANEEMNRNSNYKTLKKIKRKYVLLNIIQKRRKKNKKLVTTLHFVALNCISFKVSIMILLSN